MKTIEKKLDKITIKIIKQSDIGSSMIGYHHSFEIGEILPAVVITKKYCEDHEGFVPGFFIEDHGPIHKTFCTTDITIQDCKDNIIRISREFNKITEEKKEMEEELEKLGKKNKNIKKYLANLITAK